MKIYRREWAQSFPGFEDIPRWLMAHLYNRFGGDFPSESAQKTQKQRNEIPMAFLTGSHAYGTPHDDSDVDLVVLVTEEDFEKIRNLAEGPKEMDDQYVKNGSCSLRFGNLNLLCFFSRERYKKWKETTKDLMKRAPVTRRFACDFFSKRGCK